MSENIKQLLDTALDFIDPIEHSEIHALLKTIWDEFVEYDNQMKQDFTELLSRYNDLQMELRDNKEE